MPIGGINHPGDNPFLKRNLDDLDLNKSNSTNFSPDIKTGGADKTSEVRKPDNDKGQSDHNLGKNNQSVIDRSQFTNENEMQEIDLSEFEDDFR